MELIIISVILFTIGAIMASYLMSSVIAMVLFTLFFVLAGLFSGASFLLWLTDTPDSDGRLPAVLCSLFFTIMCVGTAILGG